MKRLLCLLLALLLLPLQAIGEAAPAPELDIAFMHGYSQPDQDALRDNRDDTGYSAQGSNSYAFTAEIPAETPLYQVFLRMDSLPKAVEVQIKNAKNKWETIAAAAAPGPECTVVSAQPITGSIRLKIDYEKNARLNLTELRLFGQGQLPAALHCWQAPEAADVLFLADALSEVDTAALALACAANSSVTVCSLTLPTGGYLTLTDALWEAGVRTAPVFGSFRETEGDGAKRLKAWREDAVTKALVSWLRQYQPLLAVTCSDVTRQCLPAAAEKAPDYSYQLADAAACGLWILPESCDIADDLPGRIAALAPRSYDALREMCAQDFLSVQHADPALIPYPDNRLADGYLPEGEFVFEDPDNGLWAYLSPTVQVEIIRCQQPEIPRVWFETEVKFKPDQEQFRQQLYVNAAFPNQQIYPETLAQTANMVLAINGDYYPYRLDRKQSAGNILRNHEVLYNFTQRSQNSFPNLDTMALLDDGSMEVFHGTEITADELALRGDVHDALSFGPYLARNGRLRIYDGYNWKNPEPRTAIGMIEPGHYIIILVEGRMPKKGHRGVNLNEIAMLMYSKGVTEAFNLDGGSTAVLIFMGKKLNLTGKDTTIGPPRNQHELFGVGTSALTHTDMLDPE